MISVDYIPVSRSVFGIARLSRVELLTGARLLNLVAEGSHRIDLGAHVSFGAAITIH